jgi:predicted XRE-type DNA-binding protein
MGHKKEDLEIVFSSKNMHRVHGHSDTDALLAKNSLATEISRTLQSRNLTNIDAEKITKVSHTEFSRIRKPDLKRFTIERLMTILNRLNPEIDISIEIKNGSKNG